MKDKSFRAALVFAFFLSSLCPLQAVARRGYEEEIPLREMRDSLDALRHEVENHEVELRMAEERANNQEAIVSSLRQQMLETNQASKDFVKGSVGSWESRLVQTETVSEKLAADLKQLKIHGNETVEALTQYKQRLHELEKALLLQNQNMEKLQEILRSLTDALQTKEGMSSVDTGKNYRVKPGDSLGEIAKKNKTTIKAIKELNELSSDKIVAGQTLLLP